MSTKPQVPISLFDYRNQSFKAKLRHLYSDLERFEPGKISDARLDHGREFQGRFISIFRQKSNLSLTDIANLTRIDPERIESIERGETKIEDGEFFKLCHVVGATNEASIFLEKLEEAFTQGLRDSRRHLAKSLAIEGFTFASHPMEQAPNESRGVVLSISNHPTRPR